MAHSVDISNALDSADKDSDQESCSSDPEQAKGSMLRHNPHHRGVPPQQHQQQPHPQKLYHYAGPPSIQMSTWQDRSRYEIPPVPVQYGAPVQYVQPVQPGIPATSRMAAGYYSLQYSSGEVGPPPSSYLRQQQSEPKYTRDAVDERQTHPRVSFGVAESDKRKITPLMFKGGWFRGWYSLLFLRAASKQPLKLTPLKNRPFTWQKPTFLLIATKEGGVGFMFYIVKGGF